MQSRPEKTRACDHTNLALELKKLGGGAWAPFFGGPWAPQRIRLFINFCIDFYRLFTPYENFIKFPQILSIYSSKLIIPNNRLIFKFPKRIFIYSELVLVIY